MRNYSVKVILQQLRAVSLQHTNIIHLVATGTSEANATECYRTRSHKLQAPRGLRHHQYLFLQSYTEFSRQAVCMLSKASRTGNPFQKARKFTCGERTSEEMLTTGQSLRHDPAALQSPLGEVRL